LKPDAAIDRAVAVFCRIGAVCADHGVVLGLEANPPAYACTFMTRWSEAAAVVRLVDHPGVRLHLDIACTEMAGDQAADGMREAADIISHLHITEPQMNHFAFGAAIAASGYADWASIEMRRADHPVAAVTQAVAFARANYPIAPAP
jgi:sugar phosphate isomerase/epimerase